MGPPEGAPWLWSVLLASALLGGYLLLAPRVSGDKDASEFALVLATGGALHPTGYPLYTILGHAFVVLLHRLGAGFPFAANAWAACGGGVAMLLMHRLALQLLPARSGLARGERFVLAALPVLVLGCNPVWMVECTVVEVHSWQLAWGMGTALYFAALMERLGSGGARVTRLPLRMAAWGLLCGLGGAHHATAVFFAGGLTLALCWALADARRFHAWVPLAWLAAGTIPLLGNAYLYFRALHPGASTVWPTLEPSLASVLAHATARAYRGYLGHWAPDGAQAEWLGRFVLPFLWPGLGLLAYQCWSARGTRRQVVTGLLASAVAQVAFAFQYGVSDPDAYFLPSLAVAVLAIVWPGVWVLARLRQPGTWRALLAVGTAGALALFMVPSVSLMVGRRQAFAEADRYFLGMWRSVPAERGIVLWPADLYYRLKEYQVFRGEKPGLDVYNTASLLNEAPRSRFRAKYGFDPLATQDRARLSEPLRQEYVIGQQATEALARSYALVHECIAERAGLPVFAFDPPAAPRLLSPRQSLRGAPAAGR